jgi:adenine-specific DNA-methyltransferase
MAEHAPGFRLPPALLRHARESRHEPTAAEQRVWAAVRDHQLGVHIRRQHALLGRFIADFYCAQARLCIEIDGDTHAEPGQIEYDAARTAWLSQRGCRVIRFTNADVFENLVGVLEAIRSACVDG